MIFKIIDGITDLMYQAMKAAIFGLGLYSVYEMVFSLDVPIGFSVPLIIGVFFFAYFASDEEPVIKVVPVKLVQDGKPIDPSELLGANSGNR